MRPLPLSSCSVPESNRDSTASIPALGPDELLPTGSSLKFDTDFRSVYATVLEKWLDIPSEPVLGQQWPLVDCLA